MEKKWFEVNASLGHPVVTIYGYLVPSKYSDDEIDFNHFIDAINDIAATNPEMIIIKINSGGGDCSVGLSIYDHIECNIKPQGIKIRTENVGLAASMGSILLMAGDERAIYPNANVVVHKPTGWACGDANSIQSYVSVLDNFENQLKAIYIAKTGQTEEVINTWLVSGVDKWFNAKTALSVGLATEVIEGTSAKAPKMKFTSDKEAWEKYYSKKLLLTQNTNDMAFSKEFLANLGLPETATEKEVQAAFDKANQTATASLEAAKNTAIKGLIDGAIASKKIIESQRSHFEKFAGSDFDGCKAVLDAMVAPTLPSAMINMGSPAVDQNKDEERTGWSYLDWMKKDGNGLASMKVTDRPRFDALLAAHKARPRSYSIGSN